MGAFIVVLLRQEPKLLVVIQIHPHLICVRIQWQPQVVVQESL